MPRHHEIPQRARRLRRTIAALALGAALALSGCANDTTPADATSAQVDPAATQILERYDVETTDASTLIEQLDTAAMNDKPTGLFASIRANGVLLADEDGNEASLPLNSDEFYVSIAPYVGHTHDCFFHSLTTCRGELADAEFHVAITDNATGEVVVDTDVTAYDNGFFGLWLPRDLDATMTITDAEGKTGTQQLKTDDEAATCVTTLQLT